MGIDFCEFLVPIVWKMKIYSWLRDKRKKRESERKNNFVQRERLK